MDQLKDFADSRLITGCIYCGSAAETRDHVPSRVLLDRPLPENLPVLPSCRKCNIGFSQDEEYVACLLEAVASGSVDPDQIGRVVVADVLRRSPSLRTRIEQARRFVADRVAFEIEVPRVKNVLLKLARGHAAYELSAVHRCQPRRIAWGPLSQLSPEERDAFEDVGATDLFPEIGSRGMQRILVTQVTLQSLDGVRSSVGFLANDWIEVQEGRYRYLTYDDADEVRVKFVIGEYLYCDVAWSGHEGAEKKRAI